MSKLQMSVLPNGAPLFHGKNTGLIFYPTLPREIKDKAYRDDFDLTHPDDWPQWCKNLHSEHAAIEVTKDGTVIWWGGTIHDGIWQGGYFMGGCWRDGIWLGGEFVNGHWITGEWRGGNFRKGYWEDGIFRAGTFSGLWMGGLWMGGTFNGFWKRTKEPPPLTIEQ
jgi:hypothetical protein